MAGQQLQEDYRDQFKGLENMDSSVMTAFKVSTQRQAAAPPSRKDKSDRATVEQALDPRTRMVSSFIQAIMFISGLWRKTLKQVLWFADSV